MPVLDAHVHCFPPECIAKRAQIAASDSGFAAIYGDTRARMVDASAVASYMDSEGIDRVVVVGFCFADPGLVRLQNDYILDAAKADARIIPFIAISTGAEKSALAEMERAVAAGGRGIGELAWYGQGFGSGERAALSRIAAQALAMDIPMMLHVNEQVGHAYAGKSRMDFAELVRFVEEHPGLTIILAHMGGGICFYEFMPEVRRAFASVYYDCAAVPFLYSDAVYAFAAAYLRDKVLFGSDYPLLGLKRYRPAIEALDAPAQRALLFDNGSRILGS
jgi:predicted TIM-barrel fold metal-dependent hydrolase